MENDNSVNLDPIFKVIEDIRLRYSEGLIDKTDTLDEMAKLVGNAVSRNAVHNRNDAEAKKTLTKVLGGVEVKLYWSDQLKTFVTIPED